MLTRSEQGSVIVTKKEMLHVAPAPVARVVDTTGAGDLYAAGFLYGLTHGRDLANLRQTGQPVRRRGHRPFRRPARNLAQEPGQERGLFYNGPCRGHM